MRGVPSSQFSNRISAIGKHAGAAALLKESEIELAALDVASAKCSVPKRAPRSAMTLATSAPFTTELCVESRASHAPTPALTMKRGSGSSPAPSTEKPGVGKPACSSFSLVATFDSVSSQASEWAPV